MIVNTQIYFLKAFSRKNFAKFIEGTLTQLHVLPSTSITAYCLCRSCFFEMPNCNITRNFILRDTDRTCIECYKISNSIKGYYKMVNPFGIHIQIVGWVQKKPITSHNNGTERSLCMLKVGCSNPDRDKHESLKQVATFPQPNTWQQVWVSRIIGDKLKNGCLDSQLLWYALNPHCSMSTSAEH